MADDATYEELGQNPPVYRGRQAIVDHINELDKAAPDFHFVVSNTLQSGDSFVMEWEMAGTNTGEYPGLPATNKPFRVHGATIGHLDASGKIATHRVYLNMADYLTQVGILPTPD
jgi:steroid delta-isomerase-like uncharacterized protein